MVLDQSLEAIKALLENTDYYCYCGGKYISQLANVSNSNGSQKVQANFSC